MIRSFISLGPAAGAIVLAICIPAQAQTPWSQMHDRVWLGADYWANPMEDWRVVDGAAESQSGGGNRNIHLLTHSLTDPDKPFEMSVRIAMVQRGSSDPSAGFRIGVVSDIGDYRANCFSRDGINAGIIQGRLTLGQTRTPLDTGAVAWSDGGDAPVVLRLVGEPSAAGYRLTLSAASVDGQSFGSVSANVNAESVIGNLSLVSNYEARFQADQGSRFRFDQWTVSGDAIAVDESRRFGPILWSMYTLTDSRSGDGFVMKITAITGPMGERDAQSVELQLEDEGQWVSVGSAPLDTDAWTATHRVANWRADKETRFRLVYAERNRQGGESISYREGTIKPNPSGRPLRMAALTCQNDYAFPYTPVAENLLKLDPDLLYFSGDQIYESHGGYGIIRAPAEPAILNYLRKYYQFGWAFGEAMRSRPTVVLPDDHDVFQGNVWGEEGAPMDFSQDKGASSRGGYAQPARMVNVVHATCTSHHPDFADRKPVKQNISVYHGDLVYGDVSFAIIADRQFKSGPERVKTDSRRADHVESPDFDTSQLDQPDLVLLGDRQEEFLREWSSDWRGHSMKVLLSQTLFANIATHHGGYDGFLKADLDSGGWPQSKRNQALRSLEGSMALHVNGDQHLASLVQYGVNAQRDSIWSFCTPAIAVGYPRWWRPDEVAIPHQNRPAHGLPNTGEYIDGLGNRAYVYAVGNPEVATEQNRYDRAHQKGSGFARVTIDPEARTYHLEAFRFLVDPTDGNPENQFPGWPLTIHQRENGGGEQRIR